MLEVTVKDGDTIWGLSRRYGVREDDIRTANADVISNGNDVLLVGQRLIVPDIYATRVKVRERETEWLNTSTTELSNFCFSHSYSARLSLLFFPLTPLSLVGRPCPG